jgi:hypothetical protein
VTIYQSALSSVVERSVHIGKVAGSIPAERTNNNAANIGGVIILLGIEQCEYLTVYPQGGILTFI